MGLLATNPTGLLANGLFNKTVSFYAPTNGTDDKGFATKDWSGGTPVVQDVSATIQRLSAQQVESFGRRGIDANYAIYTTGVDLAIVKGMRVPDPDTSGVYYTVAAPIEDMAGREQYGCIPCKRTF